MVKSAFSAPVNDKFIKISETEFKIASSGEKAYAVIGEDIEKGERVTGYTLSALNEEEKEIFSYSGTVISHKRIIEIPEGAKTVTFKATSFYIRRKYGFSAYIKRI